MYLLVRMEDALERVPAELFELFGEAQFRFSFTLTQTRRMPRIDPGVLESRLREIGYYLQLPPGEESSP